MRDEGALATMAAGLRLQPTARELARRQALAAGVRKGLKVVKHQPLAKQGMRGINEIGKQRGLPWQGPKAPAASLPAGAMEQAAQSTAWWKALSSLPQRVPALGVALKILAPLGAWLGFKASWESTEAALANPSSTAFTKRGMVLSTTLAGGSAIAATASGAISLGLWPAGQAFLGTASYVASSAGLASGAVLVAVDMVDTFRSPTTTAAEKTFSTLATACGAGVTAWAMLGLGGLPGLALGVGAVGFTLAKAWWPQAAWAGALGRAVGFSEPKA